MLFIFSFKVGASFTTLTLNLKSILPYQLKIVPIIYEKPKSVMSIGLNLYLGNVKFAYLGN